MALKAEEWEFGAPRHRLDVEAAFLPNGPISSVVGLSQLAEPHQHCQHRRWSGSTAARVPNGQQSLSRNLTAPKGSGRVCSGVIGPFRAPTKNQEAGHTFPFARHTPVALVLLAADER
jgi:hypothetical protein